MPNCVADDWGLSPGVNAGILELCESGVVQGVSLLANADHLEDGLERLLRIARLRFSLHLNLTYGAPLSPAAEVPSLCGRGGDFPGLAALALKAAAGRLAPEELRCEARRQVRRLKSLGVPVTGLEGHHHAHLIPGVYAAVAGVLREEGVDWMRLPVDPGHPPSFLAGAAFRLWSRARPRDLPPLSLRPTLYLRPGDLRSRGRLERKLNDARGLPVIVHPARENDLARLRRPDPLQEERVAAYRALRGLGAREALRG